MMQNQNSEALRLLKKYWNYDLFRPMQEEVVNSVMQKQDTIVLLPTGGGKSICYQLPTLSMEGTCLVVSPLVALMKDQVQQLNDRNIQSACLVAGLSSTESLSVLTRAMAGTLKFLYVSPERLRSRKFIEYFRRMNICLIAVDEAHCISQWGYDFRPPYLQIGEIRQYQPQAPIIALTATATAAVIDDIEAHLKLKHPKLFKTSFERRNLSYIVLHESNRTARLIQLLHNNEGSAIVYVRSRKLTMELATTLNSEGITAAAYHAGLGARDRDKCQLLWMENKTRVIVATNAFGMGIDKPDVRLVIHWGEPDSIEAYFQEAGRAGRDGKPAKAILLHSPTDDATMEQRFATQYPTLRFIRNSYRALCNYYKLPIGSGAGSRHEFSIERICDTYNLPPRDFFNACHFLELEGLIAIPDREEIKSTIYIPASREELYRFRVNHIRLGECLQALLRLYPGVTMTSTPIEERKIGARLGLSTSDVRTDLTELHEMHIIEYTPRTTNPQIIFVSERIPEGNIYFVDSDFSKLRDAAWQRMSAMQSYIHCNTTCRSHQLLAYFGEKADGDGCGGCDVCRQKRPTLEDASTLIRTTLGKDKLPVNDLKRLLGNRYTEDIRIKLREMLDRGELYMDGDMRISVS